MKQRKVLILVASVLIIAVFVVIIMNITQYAGAYQKAVYYDDSKIINQADSYSYSNRIGTILDNQATLEFRFTGMDTLWTIDAYDAMDLNIEYNSQINNGKFKIVLITPQNEIIKIIEGTSEGEKTVRIPAGENRIKIVGDDAQGKLNMVISSKSNFNIKSK